MLLPCNYVHTKFGDIGDSIHTECIADRKKQEEYLGTLKIVVLMDEQVFNIQKYGEESITTRSRIFSLQVDSKTPRYVSGRLKTNLLEDESGFFQYGLPTEKTFLDFHLGAAAHSSWIYFPTIDHPSNEFKYASIEIKMSLDLVT